jgi:hypothetical protein
LRTAEKDVDPVEQPYALGDFSVNGSRRPAPVVARDAVSMTVPIESPCHPVKDGQKPVLLLVISTDGRARVVPGLRMVEGTSKLGRQRPCLMASIL